MNARVLINALAVLVGAVAFLLVRYFPVADDALDPNSAQVINFMILAALESIGLTAGIIFAYRARSLLRDGVLSVLTYLSVIWLLISWYPHSRFHANVSHGDWWSLIYIEYAFHATAIIAAILTAVWVKRHAPVPAPFVLTDRNGVSRDHDSDDS